MYVRFSLETFKMSGVDLEIEVRGAQFHEA